MINERDEDPIETLIAGLRASDKSEVRAAVDALIALFAELPEVKSRLERLLASPRPYPVWPVAYVLGHLPRPSASTVAKLLECLDHPESDIRWAIALLLVRIAKMDGSLVALLLELRKTGTPTQRRMAIYCIRDLKLADSVGLSALFDSLADPDPGVRIAAATSLKGKSDFDDSAKKVLLKIFFEDPEIKVRNAVAATLAQFRSPPADFLAALTRAAQNEDSIVSKTALSLLAIVEKKRSVPTDR